MRKFIHYAKRAFALLITITLINCEKEVIDTSNEQVVEQEKKSNVIIESLNFNQANNESTFSNLRIHFNIEEPGHNNKGEYISMSKSNIATSSTDTFGNLDGLIDMSVVKKITTVNYTSYTMRIMASENASHSFSNLVIQERNGIEEIYTVHYTPSQSWAANKSQPYEGDIVMASGFVDFDENGGDGGDGESSGGGGSVEVCVDLEIITAIPCGCGHMPWDTCSGCYNNSPRYPSWSYETRRECHWESVDGGGSNTGGTDTTGGGGPLGPGNGDGDVITTPVSSVLPEGALLSIVDCVSPTKTQLDWLNSAQYNEQSSSLVAMWNYTNQKVCNEGSEPYAIDFIKQALDALANGGKVDFENEIIIESNVPDCVKNIINNLITDEAYLDLGDMPDEVKQDLNLSGFILNLFTSSEKFALVFKSESLGTDSNGNYKNASTNPSSDPNNPGKFIFTITLDPSYISNATDLAIARTLIHESVHAYISYFYQDTPFSELSFSLRHLLSQTNNNQNSAQHILMTTNFVSAIANSLANWNNNSISINNYYDYLSWSGGMIGSTAFANMSPTFQQNTINANISEGNAGPNGSYDVNNARGTKNCN